MINKEDPKIKEKIVDLADRNKSSNSRNFPLDENLDYSRISSHKLFKENTIKTEDYSSISVVLDPSHLENKGLGNLIDSYDFVLRTGDFNHKEFSESDVGSRSDLYFFEEGDLISQKVRRGSEHLIYSWNSNNISNVVSRLIEEDSIHTPSPKFDSFFEDFKKSHSIGEKRVCDIFFPTLFSLKGFDVVHVFGLNPFKFQNQIENLIFSMHFKGYISLKDIYE